jgi:hypothetical protein
MSLFEISYSRVTDRWTVTSVTSEYKKYVDELEHNSHEYFLTLDRLNIGVAAVDGHRIITHYINNEAKLIPPEELWRRRTVKITSLSQDLS